MLTGSLSGGPVSATYLDYPKAAERAAQLLPGAKIVILLREPVSRLVSSFNMKWQVEICVCSRPSNRRPSREGALSPRSLRAAACPLMVSSSLFGGAGQAHVVALRLLQWRHLDQGDQ